LEFDIAARRAIDRLMIGEVIDMYGSHYDEGRMDEFVELFTDDAVLDFKPDPGYFPTPLIGKEMISEHMRARNSEVAAVAQRRHLSTNTVFEHLDDDSARTESFLTVLSVEHGSNAPIVNATGVYHDVFRKVDGRWLLAERKAELDAVRSRKEPDVAPEAVAEAATVDSTGKAWASVEHEIVDEMGTELPDTISQYTALDPEMFRAYRDFRYALLDQGVIPRKDKLLMVLAILTTHHQGDAMDMYAGIARNEGATAEEVLDALRVGILFSGGPGIVAASGVAAKYGKE
jgi:alkylhydroperoxidase/carboxymuconolactone decarboxylase family protein YurZ